MNYDTADLSEDQIERYARHIHLKEVGASGQRRLLSAKVLVIGAGGLGSPLIQYLAAAGVGVIGVVDDDTVDLSNLQRQVLHTTAHVGAAKVDSVIDGVRAINPDIRIVPHKERLTAANARNLVQKYDLVADGSDNFETRFLVNDACFFERKTIYLQTAARRAVLSMPISRSAARRGRLDVRTSWHSRCGSRRNGLFAGHRSAQRNTRRWARDVWSPFNLRRPRRVDTGRQIAPGPRLRLVLR
jgi:molybdopterin/thiamine biosynthesis adenylyltransferase